MNRAKRAARHSACIYVVKTDLVCTRLRRDGMKISSAQSIEVLRMMAVFADQDTPKQSTLEVRTHGLCIHVAVHEALSQ